MKHTATPWKANMHMIGDEPRWFIQFDGIINNATIAAMNASCMVYDNPEMDAKMIVRAVNCHEQMLEALKAVAAAYGWDSEEEVRSPISKSVLRAISIAESPTE